eukprot:COSAG03_NODE_5360_length_1268_cov_1.053892_2_plen_103_part_01
MSSAIVTSSRSRESMVAQQQQQLLLLLLLAVGSGASTLPFERLTLGGLSDTARASPPPGFLASRWPASASHTLSAAEFGQGRLTAGAHVDFESNASSLTISWT